MAGPAFLPEPDPLLDPHRIAAARRLLVEVPGPAAFDRLSGLAARLLGAGHAKVTLFTDGDTVVGGHGLPPGVVGGPALLTGALSAITVRQARPLVVTDAAADLRVAALPAVTSGQVAAYLGAPLVSASGLVVGVLAVYDESPRSWTDDDGALLEQLSASVVAELELSASRSAIGASAARLTIALEASGIGIWERDLRTGAVSWDERCAAVFGLDRALADTDLDDVLGSRVHPDDHAAVRAAMARADTETGEYSLESRALRADGSVRWTVSRGRVVRDVRGEPVRMIGTILDVTEAREQSQRRMAAVQRAAAIAEVAAEMVNAAAITELAEIALRGAAVLGASASGLTVVEGDGTLRLHLTRRLVDSVASAADVRLPAEGVVLGPEDDELPHGHVARTGERLLFVDPRQAEERFPRMAEVNAGLGTRAMAALPLRVEGRLLGSYVVVWDTDHQFADEDVELLEGLTAQIALSVSRLRADAERDAANQRLQLLADVGRVLSGDVDITSQVTELTQLVVPTLGDWCWLVVTDEHGRMEELASAHRDPDRAGQLAEYVGAMVRVMTDDATARIVTRTGRPLVLPHIGDERIRRALPDEEVRQALGRLGIEGGAVVPLVARGRTIGALGLFNGPERGPHTADEVDAAVEVGRRAGLALHSARLYAQQRDLADALQHSMLTAPPEVPGCRLVVRYVPAAAGAEIGGDWYDAFPQEDGTTVLAIGDVVGHDRHAAAAMGQVRGLLRGISHSSGAPPAEVLTRLDRAMAGLAPEVMATALVARLEHPAGLEPGAVLLRWSNAGHPPPLVISPGGAVRMLTTDPELLLGVDAGVVRSDSCAVLTAGSTLLLYTDGLIERRDRDLDAGTAELLAVLREAADLPPEELCDRVLGRLFLPDAEDDVALLALRLG
ncbi:SpoIIE family protein phosphatase [Trujillonella endophytica]|uniref:protein-serine/threonine phosphatase n=1 Tax=Trujillonella endophytica TaxID=673521 RepID=A0A1H8WS96_9ACTN|nr:SpoIIE family protein phosphatase [Trujillella endophytica]SEP30307.1 PAS domain S-box-containing protein [Trujillella endophytica]